MAWNKIRAVFIGGAKGVGKDTAAEALVKLGWKKLGFADSLKEIALAANPLIPLGKQDLVSDPCKLDQPYIRLTTLVEDIGWESAKSYPEVRRFLQRLGTEGVRDVLGEFVWIDHLFKERLEDCSVVKDCRFENEVLKARTVGFPTVYIKNSKKPPSCEHASEQDLSHLYEFVVDNDGTVEELHAKILQVLEEAGLCLT